MNIASLSSSRRFALICAFTGFSTFAAGVAAQSLPETVPTIDLTPLLGGTGAQVPLAGPAPTPLVVLPQLARAEAASDAVSPPEETLLPLQGQGSARITRVSGETGVAHFGVDVPDVENVSDFFLSYRTSIDDLPERSQFRITVNGTEMDPVTPTLSDGFKRLALSPRMLLSGRNQIDVAVAQVHRIYCGPEASFQIWSEFDLNGSGVALKAARVTLTADWFKTALAAQIARQTGVPLYGAERLSPAALTDIAMRLSGGAEGQSGWLRRSSAYELATPARDLMRITVVDGSAPGITLRKGADGAIVLALVPQADGSLPDNIGSYLPSPDPIADLPAVPLGAKVTLASLGFADTSDASHYIRHDLNFRLPGDWLILASQRAGLTLQYSFPTGLAKGSILQVKVNGTTLESLPLDQGGGGTQPPHAISFPARLLHPGANALTFEATIPGAPADLPCAASSGPVLSILGQTDLQVPEAPLMRIVGMGPALLGLMQSGIEGPVPPGDPSDILANATRMALVSQMRPIAGQSGDPEASLSVVSLKTADQVPVAGLGLTAGDLIRLLPVASPVDVPVPNPAAVTPPRKDEQLVSSVQDLSQEVASLAQSGDPALHDWLTERAGDAVLIMPDTGQPAKLWLVVGPSADPVKVAQAVAEARLNPDGPRGQVAILTDQGTWQDWRPASAEPALEEPLTLMNFRFVVGAYASWSPLFFTLVLLGITALSVLLALVFVLSTRGGRKS